ncbi:MAG: hypothetical protein OSB09_04715 [Planctomycetota bacterium]|nr:hypothetical protein [Planctomycetota bacterium]
MTRTFTDQPIVDRLGLQSNHIQYRPRIATLDQPRMFAKVAEKGSY